MKSPQSAFLFTLIVSSVLLSFCTKDCETNNSVCEHQPPTDELCEAAFQRWFYSSEKNNCEQIAYSGCNEWGFDSLEDCLDCECD